MMTLEQLDRMVEECDTDIRRVTSEIQQIRDKLRDRETLRNERLQQRQTWIGHPDRQRACLAAGHPIAKYAASCRCGARESKI